MIEIRCVGCGYAQSVALDRIPKMKVSAKCPKCGLGNEIDGVAIHDEANQPIELERGSPPSGGGVSEDSSAPQAAKPVRVTTPVAADQRSASPPPPPPRAVPAQVEPAERADLTAADGSDDGGGLLPVATLALRLTAGLTSAAGVWAILSSFIDAVAWSVRTQLSARVEVVVFHGLCTLLFTLWLRIANVASTPASAAILVVNALLAPVRTWRSVKTKLGPELTSTRLTVGFHLAVAASWLMPTSQLALKLAPQLGLAWPMWALTLGALALGVLSAGWVAVYFPLVASAVDLRLLGSEWSAPTPALLRLRLAAAVGCGLLAAAPWALTAEPENDPGQVLADGTRCPRRTSVGRRRLEHGEFPAAGADALETCMGAGPSVGVPVVGFNGKRVVFRGSLDANCTGRGTVFLGHERATGALTACRRHGDWIVESQGRSLRVEPYVQGELSGQMRVLRPDGGEAEVFSVVNGTKHGTFSRFHENGVLATLGDYDGGLPHGRWVEYDSSAKEIRAWQEPVLRRSFSVLDSAKLVGPAAEHQLYSGYSVPSWRARLLLLQELSVRDAGVEALLSLAIERAKLRGVPLEVGQ